MPVYGQTVSRLEWIFTLDTAKESDVSRVVGVKSLEREETKCHFRGRASFVPLCKFSSRNSLDFVFDGL